MSQLEVKGLHKSFGTLKVLRGVDLCVDQKEVVTLIGPSGSGKSTLLRCLNLLEIPDAGELLWEGQSVPTKRPARRISRAIELAWAWSFNTLDSFRISRS